MPTLIEKLAGYGVDISVTLERFVGDVKLYETCLKMLLADEGFGALGRAIEAGDYDAAFNSAHALKGVIGNLGLAPMYNVISIIVEDLRRKEYAELPGRYSVFMGELEKVKTFIS